MSSIKSRFEQAKEFVKDFLVENEEEILGFGALALMLVGFVTVANC